MRNQFTRLFLAVMAASILLGCASLNVKKPEINTIKRIAIVSVTSNYAIHDVADKGKEQADADLATLGKTLAKVMLQNSNTASINAQIRIVTHGTAALSTVFSNITAGP